MESSYTTHVCKHEHIIHVLHANMYMLVCGYGWFLVVVVGTLLTSLPDSNGHCTYCSCVVQVNDIISSYFRITMLSICS